MVGPVRAPREGRVGGDGLLERVHEEAVPAELVEVVRQRPVEVQRGPEEVKLLGLR